MIFNVLYIENQNLISFYDDVCEKQTLSRGYPKFLNNLTPKKVDPEKEDTEIPKDLETPNSLYNSISTNRTDSKLLY